MFNVLPQQPTDEKKRNFFLPCNKRSNSSLVLLPEASLLSPVTYFSKHPGTSLIQMPPEALWRFSIFASKFHLSKAHQKLFVSTFFGDSCNLGSYTDPPTHSHSWRLHKLILLSKIINSYAFNIARLACLLFSVNSDLRGAFNKQWNPEKLSKKKKKTCPGSLSSY